jgi:hypothetical protein
MATTEKGANATLRTAVPPTALGPQDQGGRVRVMFDTFTSTGAVTISSVLRLGILPKGARVVGYWVKSTDHGTAGDIDFGWAVSADGAEAADADGFLAAADVNAAAITYDHASQANMAGLGKKFASEVEVQISFPEATTAIGTLQACVLYVID